MKKKKPKKSPTKSPSVKSSLPSKSKSDIPSSKSSVPSDAQADLVVGKDAQLPLEVSDLEINHSAPSPLETEIAASTADPTPACVEVDESNRESSSGGEPQSSSGTELKGVPDETTAAAETVAAILNNPAVAPAMTTPVEVVVKTPTTEKHSTTPVVDEDAVKKQAPASKDPVDSWCTHAKGYGKRLSKKGEAFTLSSGEACIKIPNSVIEKNRKAWDSFVLGQFYSDPPSQETLHNIVNGIWSKQYRDISV
ncbi:Uncharacterized protein Rs2_35378 [Raphanus sativus]|nr:Uncharacterized protein Rs2_35378 [Raphanus sativus]